MEARQQEAAVFASALSDRIAEGKLTLKDVAAKTEITYEHLRKLVNGDALTPPGLVASPPTSGQASATTPSGVPRRSPPAASGQV